MQDLRHLDANIKLIACFGLLVCLSATLVLWTLGQLDAGAAARRGEPDAHTVAWLGLAALGGLAALMVAWLRNELERPVQAVARLAGSMAEGDLSTHEPAPGAQDARGVGALFCTLQQTNDRLAAMVFRVRAGTENIAAGASQLAARGAALSAQAAEQAAALDATAHLAKRLNLSARAQAQRAREAARLSGTAAELAERGSGAVADSAAALCTLAAAARQVAAIAAAIDAQAAGASLRQLAAGMVAQACAGQQAAIMAADTLEELGRHASTVTGITGALAQAGGVHGEGMARLSKAVAALDHAARDGSASLGAAMTAADALHAEAGKLSHTTAAFVLGPLHGRPGAGLYLVAAGPAATATRAAPAARPRVPISLVAAAPARAKHAYGGQAGWDELA